MQTARTTANNAAAAREQANQAAGARGAAAERLTQNTAPSASDPGVYFLVSASVFLLGIGVAYLLVDPLREARERERRRDAETLAHRDRIRAELATEVGALVAQRAEIATTVANARRQMHQEAVLHPEVGFLRRADEFPHLYGTWSPRTDSPFRGMPDVGEAHDAQADLARGGGLTVPDKLADVDALIAELLGRNVAAPKSLPRVSAPRQASPPRTGSGPRQPPAARRVHARSSAAATHAARPPAAGAPEKPPQQPATEAGRGEAAPLGAPARLSPWQGLLAELDRLLRDPTLTRALKAFAAKVTAGLRGLPAVLREVARAIARAIAAIRLPRRLLLGLLALLLPLALLALLTSSDDERAAPGSAATPAPPARSADATGGGLSLPAVGMPQLVAAPDEVRPVRVALVVDRTYDTPALRRELVALGGWLGREPCARHAHLRDRRAQRPHERTAGCRAARRHRRHAPARAAPAPRSPPR